MKQGSAFRLAMQGANFIVHMEVFDVRYQRSVSQSVNQFEKQLHMGIKENTFYSDHANYLIFGEFKVWSTRSLHTLPNPV